MQWVRLVKYYRNTNRRIEVVNSKTSYKGSERRWYVKDIGQAYGPISWYEVKHMIDNGKVTPFARVREETWPNWEPIAGYFLAKKQEEMEAKAIDLPKEISSYKYIALFCLGLFVFIVGLIFFILDFLMGIVLLVLSMFTEILGFYWDGKYTKKLMKKISDVIVIVLLLFMELFILFLIWTLLY
jgi:hypothetical protein